MPLLRSVHRCPAGGAHKTEDRQGGLLEVMAASLPSPGTIFWGTPSAQGGDV